MVFPVMGYVAIGSSFAPAVVGSVRYGNLDKVMRLFTVFSVLLLLNIAAEYVFSLFKMRNYFLSDIYHLIEVPFIGLIYYRFVGISKTRAILKVCIFLFAILWVLDEIYFADRTQLNNALAMTSRFFLVVMSSITLSALLKSIASKLTTQPMFWILTGTILYSSGSFVVLAFSNELLKLDVTYFVIAWYINWILITVTNLMYAKGLLCKSLA